MSHRYSTVQYSTVPADARLQYSCIARTERANRTEGKAGRCVHRTATSPFGEVFTFEVEAEGTHLVGKLVRSAAREGRERERSGKVRDSGGSGLEAAGRVDSAGAVSWVFFKDLLIYFTFYQQ